MKTRFALLPFFALFGCTLIVGTLPERCEDGLAVSCDGNVLVSCENTVLVRVDCGSLSCNATLEECSACGNGTTDAGEECDDGNDQDGDQCESNCTLPECGNNIVDIGEECDDGGANSDAVPNACRTNCLEASCGDEVIDNGEACDDGDQNSDVQPNACRTDCVEATCGDGVLDFQDLNGNGRFDSNAGEGEQCDDGNNVDDDGCEFSANAVTNETCLATFPTCNNGVARQTNDNGDQEVCYDRAQVNLNTGDAPIAVASQNLDNDGDQDVAVVNQNNESITVFLNKGQGTGILGEVANDIKTINLVGTIDPNAIVAADVNNDGRPDLLTANLGNNISVLLNQTGNPPNNQLTFSANTQFSAGDTPVHLAVADINKDTFLDVVVANQNVDQISFLLGNGAGAFSAAQSQGFNGACDKPVYVAVADLNDDTNQDIAVACQNTDNVIILSGNGAAAPTFAVNANLAAGDEPLSVALGDINVDGEIDVAIANSKSNNVSVFFSNNGSFGGVSAVNFSVGTKPAVVLIDDVNHDPSALDLVVLNQGNNTVSILRGKVNADPTKRFAPQLVLNVGQNPSAVTIGDFEPNAYTDIVTANTNEDKISVLFFTP